MPGKPLLTYPLFLLATIITGCAVRYVAQTVDYVSPLNGNSQTYHPLPLQSDSVHTAVYAQASWFGGHANDNQTDHLSGVSASVSAAHHFGKFQCFYGLDLTMGNYNLGKWDTGHAGFASGVITVPPPAAEQLDKLSGNRFFGATGFSGGINLVKPWRRGEWRYIGLETSLHQEFGDYLSFLKKLPDSLTNVLVRNALFGTFGLTSEIIGRTRHGEWGFRLASGWVLGGAYLHLRNDPSDAELSYLYTTLAIHYTYERFTGYVQSEFGYRGQSFHLGIAYRFSRPKLAPKWKRDTRRARDVAPDGSISPVRERP